MGMGARTKRAKRIREAMPIVAELEQHTKECDSNWQTRRDDFDRGWFWLATPFSVNPRGDDVLAESNYRVIKADLERVGMEVDYRVDLWVGGSIHTLQVRSDDALALRAVEQWVVFLADYPVADDSDYRELEWERDHPSEGECYAEDDCPCGTRDSSGDDVEED